MAAAKTKTKTKSAGKTGSTEQPTIHDDFYLNLRAKITDWAKSKDIDESYRDYVLLVPDMFHFLTRMIMEPKVAIRDKAWVGIAVAYVLSPLDFIPDAFFPLGLIDDLIIMVIVLDSVLGNLPRGFVKKHWAGSGDLFEAVRDSLAKADQWVGKGMFRRLKGYLKKQGMWAGADEAAAAVKPPPVPKTAVKTKTSKTSRTSTSTRSTKKTPSRRPGGKKASKKTTKKTSKRTATKKTTKKVTKKRTIAGKKSGLSSPKP